MHGLGGLEVKSRKPATHRLVPVGDVFRLTGLTTKEILLHGDTQRLVRIDSKGSRHEFVRIPFALLDREPTDGDDLHG